MKDHWFKKIAKTLAEQYLKLKKQNPSSKPAEIYKQIVDIRYAIVSADKRELGELKKRLRRYPEMPFHQFINELLFT